MNSGTTIEWLYVASTWVPAILTAVAFHEVAHGYVAWRLGDPTAKALGRLSLNPIRHIDPMGTVVIPGFLVAVGSPFLFGWAKPVPVDGRNLSHPRRDMVLVALAGPASNLLMATLAALFIHGALRVPVAEVAAWATYTLINTVNINLLLAVFNMIPVPPLDGGRVLMGVLPSTMARRIRGFESYGLLIVVGLVFLAPMITAQLNVDFDVFKLIVGVPTGWLKGMLWAAVGLR